MHHIDVYANVTLYFKLCKQFCNRSGRFTFFTARAVAVFRQSIAKTELTQFLAFIVYSLNVILSCFMIFAFYRLVVVNCVF